jgi:hypothetical protein
MHFTSFYITGCTYVGAPTDPSESTKVEWISADSIPKLAAEGQITDGPSLTALSYYLGIYRPTLPANTDEADQ